MLKPGSQFGHYNILSLVGQGSQGAVYQAVDTRLDRQVALKVINPELADSAESRTILANEAKKAAQIDSPFVVKVWEYAEIDAHPYISYEFVTGDDFSDYSLQLMFEDKLRLARKIAEGIQAVHTKSVIHRDLKPENIRITAGGDPKILDFGLATTERGHTVNIHGEIEGTIAYASPEQLSSEPVNPQSDLFSFGVILYEMFTGRRPFEGDRTAIVMYAVLYEEPAGPQELNPDLPEWLCDLIIHLLQKQPHQRPPSIDHVIEAIDGYIVASRPVPVTRRISKRKKTITVVDLKNLSGDKSWDYFCVGFTEDVIGELMRRTDLVVSAAPSTSLSRNISDVFDTCRSDFVLTGSLLKWQDSMRLSLGVYGNRGSEIISSRKYESTSEKLFALLSEAAKDMAEALAKATGTAAIEAEEAVAPDASAYDFYLRGRNYYHTSRPDDQKFAEEMFKKAL
ncbi:MAG: protein kinase, partial [Candidatus Zixiibacteriota bacterium]